MKFNKKGQGALEYLLLIGGAVLIAVIVIALLISMGSQGKDATQKQAETAQKATDIAMPASITSIIPGTCNASGNSDFNISWTKSGGSGTYTARVVSADDGSTLALSNNTLTTEGNVNLVIPSASGIDCTKSYWVSIITSHNGQVAESGRVLLGW